MIEMTRMNGVVTELKSFNDSLLAESRKENQKVQDMFNRVAEGASGSMRQNAERYINEKVEADVAKAREEAEKKYSAEYGIARNTGFHDKKFDDAFKALLTPIREQEKRIIDKNKAIEEAMNEAVRKEHERQEEMREFGRMMGYK